MRRIPFLLLKLKSRKKCARIVVPISLFCVMSIVFMYNYFYYNAIGLFTGSLFIKDSNTNILGWSASSNRDIKIYVLPDKVTTITEPADICATKDSKNKLFLLIIVFSATENFEERVAIRETWGLPNSKNLPGVQEEIDKEVIKYGDIVQEGFIDTYHNLTIKSVMMLKWITRKCNTSVRYILKTDDDMYVNLPHLMWKLRKISQTFDLKVSGGEIKEEHLLLGHLFRNTQPIHNASIKWYSPRYMYSKKLYPPYLSGIGYVFTMPTAQALYKAAFVTKYFHLEDVYITGLCAKHSKPRQSPRNDPTFENIFAIHCDICCAHAHVTVHRAPPRVMRSLHAQLMSYKQQDVCEKKNLADQERERRMCVLYQQLGLKADECSARKIVINATGDGKFEISVKF